MVSNLDTYIGRVYDLFGWKPEGIRLLSPVNDAAEDTTWYDFAVEILKETDVEVKPVDSSQFPAKAKRPLNSTMSLAKAKATGFVIPTWQDALKEFYKQEVK